MKTKNIIKRSWFITKLSGLTFLNVSKLELKDVWGRGRSCKVPLSLYQVNQSRARISTSSVKIKNETQNSRESCLHDTSTTKGAAKVWQLTYLTIRPVARKGYGSMAHEAKPNGLLTRGPWSSLKAKGLIVLVSPNYSDRKGNNKVSKCKLGGRGERKENRRISLLDYYYY